jgi:hypothetical protein
VKLEVDAQNFIGTLTRLAFVRNGELFFIDCKKDGVPFTKAQIKSYSYTVQLSTHHIYFGKRQKFTIVDEDGVLISDAKASYRKGTLRLYENNTGFPDYPVVLLTRKKSPAWTDNIDDTNNKIVRCICKYGFITQMKEYTSYDNYEEVSGEIKLQTDTAITVLSIITVITYTELETPQKLYDNAAAQSISDDKVNPLTRVGNTITSDYNIVLDKTASQTFTVSGDTITVKCDVFTGNFDLGSKTLTLSNGSTLVGSFIDATQDSNLSERTGYSFKVYDTEAHRDTRTNELANTANYGFVFDENDKLFYLWIKIGETEYPTTVTVVKGSNEIDLGTAGSISTLGVNLKKLAAGVSNASLSIPYINDLG